MFFLTEAGTRLRLIENLVEFRRCELLRDYECKILLRLNAVRWKAAVNGIK